MADVNVADIPASCYFSGNGVSDEVEGAAVSPKLTQVSEILAGAATDSVAGLAVLEVGALSTKLSPAGIPFVPTSLDAAPDCSSPSILELPVVGAVVKPLGGEFCAKRTSDHSANIGTHAAFCALSDGDDPLSTRFDNSLLNVPLSFMSNDDLLHHISRDSVVLREDRFHYVDSSDDGDAFVEDYLASHLDMVKRSGKHRTRNSKKK